MNPHGEYLHPTGKGVVHAGFEWPVMGSEYLALPFIHTSADQWSVKPLVLLSVHSQQFIWLLTMRFKVRHIEGQIAQTTVKKRNQISSRCR